MPLRQAAQAEQLIEPRTARHEHDAHEGEEGAQQRGQLARGGEQTAEGGDLVQATVDHPHAEDDDDVGGHDEPHLERVDGPYTRDRWQPRPRARANTPLHCARR